MYLVKDLIAKNSNIVDTAMTQAFQSVQRQVILKIIEKGPGIINFSVQMKKYLQTIYVDAVISHAKTSPHVYIDFLGEVVPILNKIGDHENAQRAITHITTFYNTAGTDLLIKALEMHERAKELQEKELGPAHPDTTTTYNHISRVYDNMHKTAAASTDSSDSSDETPDAPARVPAPLAAAAPALVPAPPRAAATPALVPAPPRAAATPVLVPAPRAVAGAFPTSSAKRQRQLCDENEDGHSLESLQLTLRVNIQLMGAEHPNTATSYNKIGNAYCSKGDDSRALENFQRALQIRQRVLGANHLDTAQTHTSLGVVYCRRGDFAEALEHQQRALQIRLHTLGSEHAETAQSFNNIGVVHFRMSNHPQALESHRRALQIRLRSRFLGPRHPSTAQSYNNIGMIYFFMSEYPDAHSNIMLAIEIQLDKLGADHVETQSSIHALLMIRREMVKKKLIVFVSPSLFLSF